MKERRKTERINLNIDVECDMSEYQKWVEAKTRNLSESGICLITGDALTMDSLLELKFTLPDSPPIKVTGRVVWNEFSLNDNFYLSGIEFTDITDETLRFIQKYVSAATFDMR
jgi:5-methylcytosine-specific restriction endonuclease McrBC GTP-binding regulatory subunit McrB